jgi:hypothetical protein
MSVGGDSSFGLRAITGSAVGTNNFYQVVGGSTFLSIVTFENQRVCIDRENSMPVTFIESHNLNKVEEKGAGRAIAVHVGEGKAHLGFVVSIQVMAGNVTLFYQRWTGGTNDALVPLVCLLPENATWEDSYQHHFAPENFTFSLDSKRAGWPIVKFLNQICGPRPGGSQRVLAEGLRNEIDGCTQCSSQGPDVFLPIRLWSDYKPIACLASAKKCIWSSAGTKLKVITPLAPPPRKLNGRSRKRQKRLAQFAQEVYMPYDGISQPVVFVENLECTSKFGLFAVPYLLKSSPGDGVGDVYFGLLEKVQLNKLFSFSDLLLPAEHDDMLKKLQTTEMKLHCLDLRNYPAGVRFCTVNKKNFTDLRRLPGIKDLVASDGMVSRDCCMLSSFLGGNEELPAEAVMVSRWCGWPYEQDVSVDVADLFVSAYKTGFGSRKCTKVIGLNLYQGVHQGESATADMTRGPGEGVNHQYYRQEYTDLLLPVCETILSTLTTAAKNHARALDPIVYRLLMMSQDEDPVLGVCRRKILTMGRLAKCLGFANSPHSDRLDFYGVPEQKQFIAFFTRFLLDPPSSRNRTCAEYLQRWVHQYGGFCRPTTCGYVFLGSLKGDTSKIEIFQYFILEGLGFAVRFMSESLHHFYGKMFAHNTAVCVAIGSDGRVSYRSNPSNSETFLVFGWGGS